jgi:hypothetical protein
VTAYNFRETVFCILLCFLAMSIVQSNLANLVFLMTTEDEARLRYVEKTSRFTKYAVSRGLPPLLRDQCLAFYTYQYSMLDGVDEQQVNSSYVTFNCEKKHISRVIQIYPVIIDVPLTPYSPISFSSHLFLFYPNIYM